MPPFHVHRDGQTISEPVLGGHDHGSDLQFLVELWGFEPQTSCKPYTLAGSPQRRPLSPGKGLTCDDIRQASPHGVRNLYTLAPILAPILAPTDGQEPRRQPDR